MLHDDLTNRLGGGVRCEHAAKKIDTCENEER